MEKQGISVVIPNYNGKKLLEANLPALYACLAETAMSFEVIVADDASSDDSIGFLEQGYPEIVLVRNSTNQGFSTNIDSGIKKAQFHLVFLLNSDVQLLPGYFLSQIPLFADFQLFGVQGRIIGLNDDTLQDAAKYPLVKVNGIVGSLNYIASDEAKHPVMPTFFLSGANALVSREKLMQLGGFDEIFSPFYFEDVDLGLRAWRMGWTNLYDNRAVCRHPTSSTISVVAKKRKVKQIAARNKMLLNDRHLQGWQKISWKVLLLLKVLFSAILLKTDVLKSFAAYLKLRPQLKRTYYSLSLNEVVNKLMLEVNRVEVRRF